MYYCSTAQSALAGTSRDDEHQGLNGQPFTVEEMATLFDFDVALLHALLDASDNMDHRSSVYVLALDLADPAGRFC